MIIPGLISVTFRNKKPEEIVSLAAKAGLRGIEWGGDIHVPTGQLKQAEKVHRLTTEKGLKVSAYGSYYTVGKSKDEGIRFADVIKTAQTLNAPIIRIWAGEIGSNKSTSEYRRKVVEEILEMADYSGRKGIRLALEFHENSLNDTYQSCRELLSELNHPMIKTYWQPIHGAGPAINGAGIDLILPWIVGVHIFHWWPHAEVRLSLYEGIKDWQVYVNRLSGIPDTIFGSLEFVKDDSTKQFFQDANTLLELTRYHQVCESRKMSNDN